MKFTYLALISTLMILILTTIFNWNPKILSPFRFQQQKTQDTQKTKTIHVQSPYFFTGGPLALHQLSHYLNKSGFPSRIEYLDEPAHPGAIMPQMLEMYPDLILGTGSFDSRGNILVLPEIVDLKSSLKRYKHVRIFYWWLSWDNGDPKNFIQSDRVVHMYQADYIRDKLRNVNPKIKTVSLSDVTVTRPLNISDVTVTRPLNISNNISNTTVPTKERKDAILYNPTKDSLTSELLRVRLRDGVSLVPIANLAQSEVVELMLTSKIYVDLGHHPGKDRMPREAAASGLIVVVNKKGSAGNYVDIPDSVARFDICDPTSLAELCHDILKDYEHHKELMRPYLRQIQNEESVFLSEIKQVFMDIS